MSRQLAEIRETRVQLLEIQKQQESARKRLRVGMLLLLHDHPNRSLSDIARELECAERSVIRWWHDYREGGIDKLLHDGHKGRPSKAASIGIDEIRDKIADSGLTGLGEIRSWLSQEYGLEYSRSGAWYLMREILRARPQSGWLLLDDPAKPADSADPLALDNPMAVIDLLNSLPMTDDVVEWVSGFRSVLHRLIPDVDRISVNVNRSCDLRNPESYNLGTRINRAVTEELRTGTDRAVSVTSYKENEPPSVEIIETLRSKGVPLHDFHPPLAIDYFYLGSAYLGTVLLWKSKTSPGFTEVSETRFASLDTFIRYALTAIIARHQVVQPVTGVFAEAVEQMFKDADLSRTERRIVTLGLFGHPYKEIADTMSVSLDAVKKHFQGIFRKTDTRSQAELFAKYFTASLRREQTKADSD